MPCPCRAVSDFSRARQGNGMGLAWHVWINIVCLSTACGDVPRFGFFRLLRGHSRRLLTRMLLPFGVCLFVLMTVETRYYTEHELTLKLKPFFLLLLCHVLVCIFLSVACGQHLFKIFVFRNAHSKIFAKFFPVTFRRPNSPSSTVAQNTLWIQYFRLTSSPSSERR